MPDVRVVAMVNETSATMRDRVISFMRGRAAEISTADIARRLGISQKVTLNALRWMESRKLVLCRRRHAAEWGRGIELFWRSLI